ncbi:hypothetical protein DSECCO2_266230 [anaerobic digester metagenome]
MKKRRKNYSNAIKIEAVNELYRGIPVSILSEKYEVSKTTIYNWNNKFPNKNKTSSKETPLSEIQQLKDDFIRLNNKINSLNNQFVFLQNVVNKILIDTN